MAPKKSDSAMDKTDPNAGHRERLRARFVKGGAAAMPDYELLELTLFSALPRKDTKPLAKQLLARFGSFAEVIAAPRERLLEIPGIGDAVVSQLKIVEAAAARLAQTRIIGRPAEQVRQLHLVHALCHEVEQPRRGDEHRKAAGAADGHVEAVA